MVVRSGPIITAGGRSRTIWPSALVTEASGRLAETVARHMLVDERPRVRARRVLGHLTPTDALVTRFEDEVRARLSEPLALHELADALNLPGARSSVAYVAHGPDAGQLISRLRVEHTEHLRRTTELSVKPDRPSGRLRRWGDAASAPRPGHLNVSSSP